MKLFKLTLLGILLYYSITAVYADTMIFNKKVFELQYSECNKTSCVNKYIPEKENLKRWKEMVTITTISQGDVKKHFWKTERKIELDETQALLSYSPKINSLSYIEYSGQVADTDVIYTYLIVKNGDNVEYDFEVEDEDTDNLEDENEEIAESEDEETEEDLFEPQEIIPAAKICVYTYTRKYSAWGDDTQSIAETIQECKDNDRKYHKLMHTTEFPAIITDYYEKESPKKSKRRL